MASELGLLQVGAGAWGSSWARVIADTPGVHLAGIVDLDMEAARRTASSAGLDLSHCFESLNDGIKRSSCDALVIISPPSTHAAVALQGFAADLHCLIEKPLASTMKEATDIVQAASDAKVHAMVSQNYRFKRAARTVQRLIRDGVIGRVETVRIDFRKNPPFTGFRTEMEEPLIVDMAIHHLDQLRGIVGIEPIEVRARSWRPSWSRFSSNSSAIVEIVGSAGEQVIYTGSWSSHGVTTTWDGAWEIEGERGAISWKQNRVTVHFESVFDTVFLPMALEREGAMEIDLDHVDHEERSGTLREFRAAIVEHRSPETSVVDNIKSLQVVLGAVESARADGSIVNIQTS